MTLQDLTRLVSLGEGPFLEFKRKVPRPERIAKELIAFANTRGGQLLLGVDDDGAIVGVRDAHEEEFALDEALSTHCEPSLTIRTENIPVTRRREVIVVHVAESDSKPHFLLHCDKTKTAYVRVEDMSIEASRERVGLLRKEKAPSDVKFTFGDNELLLMRYLEQYGRITVDQFATIANLPGRRASHILVLLARARIIRLHSTAEDDYFTLVYQAMS